MICGIEAQQRRPVAMTAASRLAARGHLSANTISVQMASIRLAGAGGLSAHSVRPPMAQVASAIFAGAGNLSGQLIVPPIPMFFSSGISLGTNVVLSNSDLTATCGATANQGATSINGVKIAGKYYMEWTATSAAGSDGFGIRTCASTYAGITSTGNTVGNAAGMIYPSGAYFAPLNSVATGQSFSSGANVGVAIDLGVPKIWYRINGGAWTGSGDPATGTGGISLSDTGAPGEGVYPAVILSSNTAVCTANFGASTFAYGVPSGFLPWNSSGNTGSAHIDVGSVGSNITTSSTAPTLTISSNGGSRKAIIMVAIEKNTGIPSVSSVTASGLTFSAVGSAFNFNDGTRFGSLEVWEAAVGSSFSGKTVTVNLSGAPDACWVCGFVVNGYSGYDASSPWTNSANSASPTVSVSTSGAAGLLIGGCASIRAAAGTGPQFASACSPLASLFENSAVTNDLWGAVQVRTFTSVLSSYSFANGTITSMIWGNKAIALDG